MLKWYKNRPAAALKARGTSDAEAAVTQTAPAVSGASDKREERREAADEERERDAHALKSLDLVPARLQRPKHATRARMMTV